MTYDKLKFSKQDNKQLGRKAFRLLQLNLRFCILLLLLLITVIVVACLNRTLHRHPKHLTLHQYVRNFFNDPYQLPLRSRQKMNNSNNDDDECYEIEDTELIWSDETVELFQDQLGIIIEDGGDEQKTLKCRLGEEFIVSALPGPNDENLSDIVWQYVSLIALESQTIQNDDAKQLSLKAFVTEQMRAGLNELFEG